MDQDIKEIFKMVTGISELELNAIDGYFDDMQDAEKAIAVGQKKWPKNESVVWDIFPMLMPSEWSRQVHNLYPAHCRELVDRVGSMEITNDIKEIDLSYGTDVEFCAVMKEASSRIPLPALHVRLYYDAFNRVVGRPPIMPPEVQSRMESDISTVEEWPGQAKEEEQQIKANIAQDWRVLERVDGNRWRKKRDKND